MKYTVSGDNVDELRDAVRELETKLLLEARKASAPQQLENIDIEAIKEFANKIVTKVTNGHYLEDETCAVEAWEVLMTALYGKEFWAWFAMSNREHFRY